MKKQCSFRTFFLGGFECSSHRNRAGRRLDVIAASKHDHFADLDYKRLKSFGIETARDGVRWHLIERDPGCYDFSSAEEMVRAAEDNRMQIIWDLLHYGWPDGLDVFHPEFVDRFCRFAEAFARFLAAHSTQTPYFCPVNEISFTAWAAGEEGFFFPFERGRGNELKAQLIRAATAAMQAILEVLPNARFVHVDPAINIVIPEGCPRIERQIVEAHRRAMYDAWDMIAGRKCPELGGREEFLDIIGVNYYVHNQWIHQGGFIEKDHPGYRPLHDILWEIHSRYERPIFIGETGIENERRPSWLAYVCDEAVAAIERGVPLEGICLYPIVNHPGWDDDRHCHNGLWDYCNDCGHREVYSPLADELLRQGERIAAVRRDFHHNEQCVGA